MYILALFKISAAEIAQVYEWKARGDEIRSHYRQQFFLRYSIMCPTNTKTVKYYC